MLERNLFTFVGRVGYIDSKEKHSRFSVGQKLKDDTYRNILFTCFGLISDTMKETVSVGDYIMVQGYLNENKYNDKSSTECIVTDYNHVKFDEVEGGWVVVGKVKK